MFNRKLKEEMKTRMELLAKDSENLWEASKTMMKLINALMDYFNLKWHYEDNKMVMSKAESIEEKIIKEKDCEHKFIDDPNNIYEFKQCLKCDYIIKGVLNPVPSPMPKEKCKCKMVGGTTNSVVCEHGNLITRTQDKTEKHNVNSFASQFCKIAPYDLENLLEWLEDRGSLSESGKKFRMAFWELFIKE